MDGDYRDSDGGPWTSCARCGASIAYDPDAVDGEWGGVDDQYCAECAAEMAVADEGEE